MAPTGIITGILFLALALYCGLDPFRHSAMSDFPNFESIQGPESLVFDPLGKGPYTGVADGRVLFWNGKDWTDFAFTSSNRSPKRGLGHLGQSYAVLKPSPLSYMKNEHYVAAIGPRFNKKTGDLYIADAYFGLMVVGPEGGLATLLVNEAEAVPLRFTNDLDIDEEGNIYFTDSSTNYQRRLRRYWLKGEKAGSSEVFAILPGFPDNVRTNENGEFWVAYTVVALLLATYTAIILNLGSLCSSSQSRPSINTLCKLEDGSMQLLLSTARGKTHSGTGGQSRQSGKGNQ
ncbi:hypothetical protein IFM89_016253 [Coptis chinensis]|uniref:Strictosidine synthase n=1 Tax=Coptis chinensis TaxID=261450 RepID=A0A835H5I5_9MAGN|nr:hypothetical protein IFM89_016253 [Coptis chinensis]